MNPADNSPLWIRGARVIDPSAKRDEAKGDVFALDGKFVDHLSAADQAKARVIDGQGLVVAPGFVDLNCRLGEPGRTARETIRSGTRAAAAGGFTTVVTMPDCLPAADNIGTIQLLREICARDAAVRVLPTGTLTKGHEGKALAPLGTMKKAGVVAVTDTTSGVQNNEIMRRALEYAAMFDLVVLDHCQDSSMTEGGQMHEAAWSLRLGLRGLPRAAEEIVVSSDCLLAELTKARIHLQHLSSGGSAEIVRRAKARGLSITAEVSALHLLLTDGALAQYDTHLKLNPPLREESDRLALIAALVDGTIDAICSDHSPCTATEKDCEFDQAPFGAATLETTFAAAYEAIVAGGHADLALLLARLTSGPARVLGLNAGTLRTGAEADLVLIDPKTRWTTSIAAQQSKGGNNPLAKRTFTSRIRSTYVGGRLVSGTA
ncbi:MAG: dihydroorotase [Verrucomicrobia bacterium]|nr:dihydroorotase [Verrucomicrobiota bacterium]NBS04255.1 dihydroorotase [Verrucomicrobiota bacterium]NBY36909.1 dihydroorotase [Verrucomicrobiota bacterium]